MNNLLMGDGNELEAEGQGLFVQAMLVADGLLLFFLGEDILIVSSAGADQVVDDAGQFMGRSSDGLRSAQTSSHTAIISAQVGVTLMQRLRGQSQGSGETAVGLAGF